MKTFTTVLVLLTFGLVPLPSVLHNTSAARIINSRGEQIISIFQSIAPNPRLGPEYYREIEAGRNRSSASCPTIKSAVFRESDGLPQLLKAQGGCPYGHYQVDTYRDCVTCGGGIENWTYSDSEEAEYCDGYAIDFLGCGAGCREDTACYNNSDPTCY